MRRTTGSAVSEKKRDERSEREREKGGETVTQSLLNCSQDAGPSQASSVSAKTSRCVCVSDNSEVLRN